VYSEDPTLIHSRSKDLLKGYNAARTFMNDSVRSGGMPPLFMEKARAILIEDGP
jgi:hypothetical protein